MALTDLDATKPDGSTQDLSVYDDHIRQIKTELLAWVAVEHTNAGSHLIPYLDTSDMDSYAYRAVGTVVANSDDGYLYRCTVIGPPATWVRIQPKGNEHSYTDDTTPSVLNIDRVTLTPTGAEDVTDFDDGVAGQVIDITTGNSSVTIKHGAGKILLDSHADYAMGTGDNLTLVLWADGAWRERSRRAV